MGVVRGISEDQAMINTTAYIITEEERHRLMFTTNCVATRDWLATLDPSRDIEGHKLLKNTISIDRDFEADAGQRDYTNENTCEHCGRGFKGLSSRTTCRACTPLEIL